MSMAQSRTAVLGHSRSLAEDISLVVIGSAFMALCAHVSIPLLFSPVPLTLQTFGVLVIALTLGPHRGFAALSLYLLEGASGLPVFSPAGPGGIAQLLGPTGGFLMAYPLAAYVAGQIFAKRREMRFAQLASFAGEIIILSFGLVWLKFVAHLNFGQAFTMAVLPFLPGEVIKIVAASFIGVRTKTWLNRLR